MTTIRVETDSLGEVEVPSDRLWGAQTQRSLRYFNIGEERMPLELVRALAIIKKAAAQVNARSGRLAGDLAQMIAAACDEILVGRYPDEFPLHVWMTGSGTQLNMNVNEVIANICSRAAAEPLGSKRPVHPNDHVNMAQSSNDVIPAAMHIAAAEVVVTRLVPALIGLRDALADKAAAWSDIVKVGRTHLQDATPLMLGQEFGGYATMLTADLARTDHALLDVYELAAGGTAVGTGINAPPGFDTEIAAEIASLTGLPFVAAADKFAAQGSHDALVALSGALKTTAASLHKIANDIRLLASGPRAGIGELVLPANEPGSSIMPGKVNPTQCEAMAMLTIQVMANDLAVTLGAAGGHLEMNVYKPLIAHNVMQSIRLLADGCTNFHRYAIEGLTADRARIAKMVERSLMLVTALTPVIGYDNAARVAHHAVEHDTTPKDAAEALGLLSPADYDRLVDPAKLTKPYVAANK
jgi:fumarate hydratase class II